MGCTGSKSPQKGDIVETPKPPQPVAVSEIRGTGATTPPPPSSQKKGKPGLIIERVGSNRSLNSGNEIEDIQVAIPDPFRSQYKVIEELHKKGLTRIKKGISRDKKEVLIETTSITDYNASGLSELDYFERLDILRKMDYTSIPSVLDFFDNAEMYRIVSEYPLGKDLALLLKKNGAMAPQNIVAFSYCLTCTIEYMHSLNVVHRFVEPANIVLTTFNNFSSSTHMKLIGMDRPVCIEDEESRLKVKGVSVDDITPYSAPELASAQHSFEVDLYSLGATIYSAVTGEIPPSARSDQIDFSQKVWSAGPLAAVNLQEIVESLMSVEPSSRMKIEEVKRKLDVNQKK